MQVRSPTRATARRDILRSDSITSAHPTRNVTKHAALRAGEFRRRGQTAGEARERLTCTHAAFQEDASIKCRASGSGGAQPARP